MSKMGDSLNRMFGRKKKAADLAARLESSILAGKEGSEALSALRELAAKGSAPPTMSAVGAQSSGAVHSPAHSEELPDRRGYEAPETPSDFEPRPASPFLEMRDLVESLPEIDVYQLAERSRIVAQTLRRQNRSHRNEV